MDPPKTESKDWIKHFWTNCNKEKSENHDLWSRVSEMVGYLSGEEGRQAVPVGADCTLSTLTVSVGGGGAEPAEASSADEPRPVRRVVCSPDLPVGFQPPTQPPLLLSSTTVTPSSPSPAPSTVAAASPQKPIIAADSTAETLQCPSCQKSFASRTAFQAHVKTHKDGEDPYQCNFCGKTFAVPARLTRHYRTHTGEKPYHCEYCTKSFSVKENLSVHRRIHTKERPYKCDICERAFEHSGKLHRHMRIHTGERPHKCAVCNKTFIQSGQLVIHMRTHTGEKPYVCKDCGKGFTCSKQLKVHHRTHSGEKPYSCDICGKSFGYNHVLKLHQVAHYGEKVYKCTICNQTFASKKTMESHIKSHSENGRSDEIGQPSETESSCASSASDKENKTGSEKTGGAAGPTTTTLTPPGSSSYPNIRELCGYLYKNEKPGGLNPALLAAVAVASSENDDGPDYQPSPDHILETPGFGVTEPVVYLVPEPVASIQRRHPSAAPPLPTELIPLGSNRRRLGSASDDDVDPLLTPPSSNPVSPVSSSPEPSDAREVLILPPRKRSKAILQSMESDARPDAPIRYSSVIQYAKAS